MRRKIMHTFPIGRHPCLGYSTDLLTFNCKIVASAFSQGLECSQSNLRTSPSMH